jgi:arabinan endo-1,5-alpha-L-arabinosidase
MTVGPVGIDTWLRIVKHTAGDGTELYTAYTSNDGVHWTRGGTWTHNLGPNAQIGIAAQNLAGFTVDFDYVRVYRLAP